MHNRYLTVILRSRRNYESYLADKAGYNKGIYRKIEQDNCFIMQHIDHKAKFYCKKATDDLPFDIYLRNTRNYIYRRIFVDNGGRMFSAVYC